MAVACGLYLHRYRIRGTAPYSPLAACGYCRPGSRLHDGFHVDPSKPVKVRSQEVWNEQARLGSLPAGPVV